ncbi:Cyclin-dependent protein kinase complex component [Madurella fahalii]|uniref:Cyclin-dependent protein kinase complex component n=1 Tax=Madurella fahalii TaxID=1157608 RepID=A0ABQ0GQ97_9PEZI
MAEADARSDSSSVPSPPPPPDPSADPTFRSILAPAYNPGPSGLPTGSDEIFHLSAVAVLQVICAGMEVLVNMTGDIPPTPPPKSPKIPHMKEMEAEKRNIVRSNSEKNLARLAQGSAVNTPKPGRSPLQKSESSSQSALEQPPPSSSQAQPIDGVQLRPQPRQPSSEPQPQAQLPPYVIVGEDLQALNTQHNAIIRKFYCRRPPPISITDYLLRIQQYCPMSVGVYLATSLYIHRLAVLERAIVVTKRNAHRLLLSGLRVATKALEDQHYKHNRIAHVGGVSEKELSRLEISFCFLTGFELAVTARDLSRHWELIRKGPTCWDVLDETTQDMVKLHLEGQPGWVGNSKTEEG